MSDTPITDADDGMYGEQDCVSRTTAERVERKLNSALSALRQCRDTIDLEQDWSQYHLHKEREASVRAAAKAADAILNQP